MRQIAFKEICLNIWDASWDHFCNCNHINSNIPDSFFHNSFACLCVQAHLIGCDMPLLVLSGSTFSNQLQKKKAFSMIKGHSTNTQLILYEYKDLNCFTRNYLGTQVVAETVVTSKADKGLFHCIRSLSAYMNIKVCFWWLFSLFTSGNLIHCH